MRCSIFDIHLSDVQCVMCKMLMATRQRHPAPTPSPPGIESPEYACSSALDICAVCSVVRQLWCSPFVLSFQTSAIRPGSSTGDPPSGHAGTLGSRFDGSTILQHST